MMLVHTRDTLTYACMLVGQFFHTVPQPASPPPGLLSAPPFSLLSPLAPPARRKLLQLLPLSPLLSLWWRKSK